MAFDILKIGICNKFDDGSQAHFKRLMEIYDVKFVEFNTQIEMLESLSDGVIDLVGTSGISAFELGFSANKKPDGLEISVFLPRRDPTLIMVSKDNLEHLPRKAKIFTKSKLTGLQLKRFRTDFEILNESDFQLNNLSHSELIGKLDELCDDCNLDAYIIERSEWNEFKKKGRRRSLGMQIGNTPSRQRFIPPPLRGFSVLISRSGFPSSIFEDLDDSQARICFGVESRLYLDIDSEELVGINASIRRISTISKTLSEEGGLTLDILDEKLLNLERFDDSLKDVDQMVEVIIETLDDSGKITCSLEKKYLVGDDEFRILKIFLEEWRKILDLTQR
ncbi:MAG: hypothetical protein CMB64_00755 [Euryarchaeota archaeon]|nr:hypothetical protein [Euryarchaeota archaeon]|tara:strand:+ start:320 stop:1324 length:1005 start_codon:yes stop_codon:yes gene_type:complete